jgi:DNA primase
MNLGNVDLTRELVQAVRDAVSIVDIAGDHTRLRRAGKRYEGLCPLHKEKTPSFSVDPDQGLFYCFGCGAGGDAIKLHMLITGDDFPAAIEALALRYGIPLSRGGGRRGGREREREIGAALEAAQAFFEEELRRSESARSYLAGRRIPPELVTRYRLGYAPDSWDALQKALGTRIPLEALAAAGLVGYSEKSGRPYDRFRHRLTFAIASPAGRLVGFGGRALGDDRAKYVNTAETERFHKGSLLFGLDQAKKTLRDGGRAVLVEGYFDALAVAAAGVEGAVAGMGTALTREQAQLLARYASEVVVAYDGDSAGQSAYRRALPLLLGAGLAVFEARLGEGHDPDSLRLAEGPEALAKTLKAAPDGLRAEIERLTPLSTAGEPRLQSRAAAVVVELLKPIPDAVLRFGYGRIAAQRLALPVDLLARRLVGAKGAATTEPPPGPKEREEPMEMAILSLLLSGEEVAPPAGLPPAEAFRDIGCRNIYRVYCTLYGEGAATPPTVQQVVAQVEGDEDSVALLARLMIERPLDSQNLSLAQRLAHLQSRFDKERRIEIDGEIREAQEARDAQRLERLLEERVALNRRRYPVS